MKETSHYKRYREIAAVLSRHGLGWLAIQLNLGRFIPFHKGLLGHPKRKDPYTQAEHMLLALEELGTTFIKLGQILGSRPDLLPNDYVVQFRKLQDKTPPVPFKQVEEVIVQELGAPAEKVFKVFDPMPRAAASIGQAHNAQLQDGTHVVVKAQRPGVEQRVNEDLAVMSDIVHYASHRTALGRQYDIVGWFDEFAFTLRNELDYTREATNADTVRCNFQRDARLHVPRIFWKFTTKRVITMEEISGIKISNTKALEKSGLSLRQIAENFTHIILTMTLKHGFFHADPHAGNLFVLPGDVIALLDYGMMGRLDETLRELLLRIFMAVARQDAEQMVEEFLMLGSQRVPVNRQVLKRDFDHFIQLISKSSLKEIGASHAFSRFISIARHHQLQLPSDLVLFFKVLAMSEGLGLQVDPEFRMLEFAKPYFKRFWLNNFSPARLAKKLSEALPELAELGFYLSKHARHVIWQLERGETRFNVRIRGVEEKLNEIEGIDNRISTSILTAALIVGLGLLMLIYHPPGWEHYAGWVFGTLFFVVIIFAVALLWEAWRSGKKRS